MDESILLERATQRFWTYVTKGNTEDDCWGWYGPKRYPTAKYPTINETPHLWVVGQQMTAYRFSYLLHNGHLDPDLLVCHTCDNPLCCNPKHLWQGTHKDNSADMIAKGRHRKPKVKLQLPNGEIVFGYAEAGKRMGISSVAVFKRTRAKKQTVKILSGV